MPVIDLPANGKNDDRDIAGDLRILADQYEAGQITDFVVAYLDEGDIQTIVSVEKGLTAGALFSFGAAEAYKNISGD